ncbi:MAG: hypothetical protein Q9168_004701 [Polycauliona sp. 1 TL-2023]
MIFKHAETAFIWLTRHSTDQLAYAVHNFVTSLEDVEHPETLDFPLANLALESLLQDPWFSSLWTLQEAYLRKDALLLSTQAECISMKYQPKVDLRLLTVCCNELYPISIPTIRERLQIRELTDVVRMKEMIQESGLGLLHSDSPFTLYTAARFRNTKFELDRIYGIMQIFGLQLGSAATGAESTSFTLRELEDQLGNALLQNWPIRSQFHIHTKPSPVGSAWRISESSAFPELVDEYDNDLDDWEHIECRLSTQRHGDTTWGYFKGRVCKLAGLASAWRSSSKHHRRKWTTSPLQMVALDASHTLREAPSSLHALNQLVIPRDETQHEVCSTLVQMFGDEIVVLALGFSKGGKGLILVRQEAEGLMVWHRIGICYWNTSETDDPFILGHEGSGWWDLEGLFG